MRTVQSLTALYDEYLRDHPTFADIDYSDREMGFRTPLHPVFVMSRYIIDAFINRGERRIAIVLPDDNCSVLSLIVSHYFQNLQEDPYYAANIFESLEPGQHIKLLNAVAEFLEIDNAKQMIKYRAGKPGSRTNPPMTTTTPIANYHLLLEKTGADVSSVKAWEQAKKKVKEQDPTRNLSIYLSSFKQKRTGVRKSIVVLAPKNEMKGQLAGLKVEGQPLESIIAYGELTGDKEKPYSILNKGKLDCIPGIAVSNRLSYINTFISCFGPEMISCIYAVTDKFREVSDNLDSFKRVLKAKVPTVLFVPESEFEKYDVLRELGFVFWQWKPATLKSECFITDDPDALERSIYSHLASKINKAARASYKVIKCSSKELATAKAEIKTLFGTIADEDTDLRRILIKLNRLHKHISYICYELSPTMLGNLSSEWESANTEWCGIKSHYENLPVSGRIDAIFDSFMNLITESRPTAKIATVSDLITSASGRGKVYVVLPDDIADAPTITLSMRSRLGRDNCTFLRCSDFIALSESGAEVDTVIVPWFDSSKYIKIKQTYCYKNLIYVLFDFENRWRSAFIRRLDSSFPNDEIKKTATRLKIPARSINDSLFDDIETDSSAEDPSKDDYDFDRAILRHVAGGASHKTELPDSIECVPVILSGDTVGYFGAGHEFVDVTDICRGRSDKAEKLTADKLSQGHIIMIRQSGRDLITDKADELMEKDGKSTLREISSAWSAALSKYAVGKTVRDVVSAFEKAGLSCSSQLVRNWILGETICPSEMQTIEIVARISGNKKLLADTKKVYAAGSEVQEYHRKAGKWLSSELKSRAKEISDIYSSGNISGTVEGIGEIRLYTVEEVLNKEYVTRNKINTMEVYA